LYQLTPVLETAAGFGALGQLQSTHLRRGLHVCFHWMHRAACHKSLFVARPNRYYRLHLQLQGKEILVVVAVYRLGGYFHAAFDSRQHVTQQTTNVLTLMDTNFNVTATTYQLLIHWAVSIIKQLIGAAVCIDANPF
jgi:hypothetical protein